MIAPDMPRTVADELRDALLLAAPTTLGRAIDLDEADALARRLLMKGIQPVRPPLVVPLQVPCECSHELRCFVAGMPETQGSQRAVYNRHLGRPVIISDNPDLKAWRRRVQFSMRSAAARTIGRDPLPGNVPVGLSLVFVWPRPKLHLSQSKSRPGALLPSAPRAMISAIQNWSNGPDLDKLVRAIGDSLTVGRVITDDRQIDHFHEPLAKVWADEAAWWGKEPGVWVRVTW